MEQNKNEMLYMTYWKQAIKDYIDCSDGYITDKTDEEIESVVEKLMDDNEFWTFIDDTIDYYLLRIQNKNKE